MKTRSVCLGAIADTCLGKMLDQQKNKGNYQPYLANVNVRWGEFDLDNLPQMRFLETEQERYGLHYGDILVCEGGEPGRCAIWKEQIPNMKFQKALHRVRVHKDAVAYRGLFYRFLLAKAQGEFDQYFSGTTTIKHMPGDKLVKIRLDLPELPVQQRIGEILTVYDDLIETNQRQIKLLEEVAQRLYKEWFVDLRYPGHENVLVVDGVPEMWKRTKMDDVCQAIGGGTPSTSKKEYYEGGTIKWVTPTDLTKTGSWILLDTEKKITREGLDNSSAKMLPPNTILMTSRASIGYIAICEHEVCTNQGFISCIPYDDRFRYYLMFNLLNRVDEIKSKATGSTFLEIAKRTFRDMAIIKPADDVIHLFNMMVDPLISQIRNLQKQVGASKVARDRLLPKLMSGEIAV